MERLFSAEELRATVKLLNENISELELRKLDLQEIVLSTQYGRIYDWAIKNLITMSDLIFNYKRAVKKLKADVQWEIQTEVF